jgi:hypothetical protein
MVRLWVERQRAKAWIMSYGEPAASRQHAKPMRKFWKLYREAKGGRDTGPEKVREVAVNVGVIHGREGRVGDEEGCRQARLVAAWKAELQCTNAGGGVGRVAGGIAQVDRVRPKYAVRLAGLGAAGLHDSYVAQRHEGGELLRGGIHQDGAIIFS